MSCMMGSYSVFVWGECLKVEGVRIFCLGDKVN